MAAGMELDEAVAEALARGDHEEAVRVALAGLERELRGFLFGVLLDRHAADEVLAMFSEDLWKSLDTFEGRASVRTWCYRLARSACARYLRDPHWRRERPLDLGSNVAAAAPRTPTPTWRTTPFRDAVTRLREELDPEARSLLILRVDRRMSWREIVVVQGDADAPSPRQEAAVRKRFQRIKEHLARRARQEGLIP